jgi:hypothetical protein
MSFSTFGLPVTVGMATLAFAIAAPASAQEHSAQKHYVQTHYAHTHYVHTHYAHAHYRHYARYGEGRQIIVHPQPPVRAQYGFGPAVAVGNVVGGAGQAVQAVFNGAGAVVGGILGGVFGGASAIFGYPHYAASGYAYGYGYGGPGYSYAGYGAPFAAPFNAAGAVAAAPFELVSGALEGTPPAGAAYGYAYAPATGAPAYSY